MIDLNLDIFIGNTKKYQFFGKTFNKKKKKKRLWRWGKIWQANLLLLLFFTIYVLLPTFRSMILDAKHGSDCNRQLVRDYKILVFPNEYNFTKVQFFLPYLLPLLFFEL